MISLATLTDFAGAVALPPFLTMLLRNAIRRFAGVTPSPGFPAAWAINAGGAAVLTGATFSTDLSEGWWGPAGFGTSALIALAVWWWRRKKRRKVAALLGAKARAIRDAMVRKVRETTTPRPVLRPVPVARCAGRK